jgi:hypothetical protein
MRFPNRFAGDGGGAALNFAALTLVMAVLAGGIRLQAESREIQSCGAKTATSLEGSGGSCRLLGEIDDPTTGARWRLVRDPSRPGGPGRLEPVSQVRDPGAQGKKADAGIALRPASILRAGDRVVVEEHSATTDAYLEGVALGPAGPGTAFHVRLSIGNRVVRAVAVAPGRAMLEAVKEAGR